VYRTLDIFSGIGGFSLGLERTGGFKTVAFCEIDPFCRRVLAKHWPEVPCYHDVRQLTADALRRDGIAVDAICGGFPCQDISIAGKRTGLEGARSGLWGEYRRLIGEIKPRWVVVENVANLLAIGMGDVLRDLAALGYDAMWDCIPASAVGAPHRRDRVWIVAHPSGEGRRLQSIGIGAGYSAPQFGNDGAAQSLANPRRLRCSQYQYTGDVVPATSPQSEYEQGVTANGTQCSGTNVAHAFGERQLQPQGRLADQRRRLGDSGEKTMADASRPRLSDNRGRKKTKELKRNGTLNGHCGRDGASDHWCIEPDVGRVADGIPARVDRLRALGNAVVPQVVELIGRAIINAPPQA